MDHMSATNETTKPTGQLVIRTVTMPKDTNPNGDIFGGWIMSQMDHAAGTAAMRRAAGRVVTAAVDGMAFISPVHVGDEVSLYASVLSVGNSSMKIMVEAWRRPRESDETVRVTKAIFTFVAIDGNGRPRTVPPEQLALEP
jgi:acyl-CoA thioesterase YciA